MSIIMKAGQKVTITDEISEFFMQFVDFNIPGKSKILIHCFEHSGSFIYTSVKFALWTKQYTG